MRHLYLHIPFCVGKCLYCGFYSVERGPADRIDYAVLLCREYDGLAPRLGRPRLETIYTGGGTPGLLGAPGFRRLAGELRARGLLEGITEWTVELNPASSGERLLADLRAAGVNRISLGAQSFNAATLARLGRRHDAAGITRAVARVRRAGFDHYGLDLIAGLPGVTDAQWRETLARAVDTGIEHLSVYGLGVEPGTALHTQVAGGLQLPDADAQLDALALAEQILTAQGFERYEISNYARPGRACRHNLAVWRGADYLGLGPSAASRLGRRRWTNRPDLDGWLAAVRQGEPPPRASEDLWTDEEDAVERLVFALRLNGGIDPADLARRVPSLAGRARDWEARLARLASRGIVARPPGAASHWRLTARGREVADAVIADLL
jgi:oxygen-independent coproporphyrinogen-3 oxidase